MNTELALANIRSRMRDMGFREEDYSISQKHLVLQGGTHQEIEAYNEIYYLEHDPADVSIRSDFGLYDLSFSKTNELKYEHRGFISVRNNSSMLRHVRFIHITLKHRLN